MIHNHSNKTVYCWEQVINITIAEIIPRLHPQIPDELKRRCCGFKEGANRREKERKLL